MGADLARSRRDLHHGQARCFRSGDALLLPAEAARRRAIPERLESSPANTATARFTVVEVCAWPGRSVLQLRLAAGEEGDEVGGGFGGAEFALRGGVFEDAGEEADDAEIIGS